MSPAAVEALPAINATLNGTATALLLTAYVLVKRGKWRAHAYFMISALVVSTVFLVSYLTYHAVAGEKSTTLAAGVLRDIYLVILLPHILLSGVMLPMIAIVLWQAYKRRWDRHRRWARPTFWIWLYVSVTGVVIYFMLYHLLLPRVAAAQHAIGGGG